jgi:serine/threonine protein kinase
MGVPHTCKDVYAVGVVLFTMLTGTFPFPVLQSTTGLSTEQTRSDLSRTRQVTPPAPSRYRLRLSPKIDACASRMLDPDPARRFSTAMAAGAHLDEVLAR